MRTRLSTASVATSIALVFPVLGIVGCGSGEGHLTKAEFLQRGNAICAGAQAEEVKLAARYRKEEPETAKTRPDLMVAPVVVPPLEKQLRRLRALDPPQEDEKKLRTIFKEMEKGIEDAKFDPIDLLVEETDPFVRADELAGDYGLKICARSSHAVVHPPAR